MGAAAYLLVRTLVRCPGFRAAALSSAAIGGLLVLASGRLPAVTAFLLVVPASSAAIIMDQTHYYSVFKALHIVGGNPRLTSTYRLGVSLVLALTYLPTYLLTYLYGVATNAYLLAAPPAAFSITCSLLYVIERAAKGRLGRAFL